MTVPRDVFNRYVIVLREELHCLWNDLRYAHERAMNGVWSIECDGLEERIKLLTRLVGPTPWERIQVPLLLDGIYQRIMLDVYGQVTPETTVDMDKVRETWQRITGGHGRGGRA